MKYIIDWALDRLTETSTWRGIILILTSAGVHFAPNQSGAIITAGLALVGAINVFRKEAQIALQPSDPPVPPVAKP